MTATGAKPLDDTQSAPTLAWCPRSSPAEPNAAKARSPRPATPTPAGCWSKLPGTTTGADVRASFGMGRSATEMTPDLQARERAHRPTVRDHSHQHGR